MTAVAHCPICLDHFRIDADKPEFVVFPCGTLVMLPSYQRHLILGTLFIIINYNVHNLTGHGFCKSCTDLLFPTSKSTAGCPNCREFIRQRDGHPVYLELVDSKLAVATGLIKGFGKMNADTPLSSLKETSVKLEHVSKEIPDHVVVGVLLFFLKHALKSRSNLHSNRHSFRAQSKTSTSA
jgi:hypothetical protein